MIDACMVCVNANNTWMHDLKHSKALDGSCSCTHSFPAMQVDNNMEHEC